MKVRGFGPAAKARWALVLRSLLLAVGPSSCGEQDAVPTRALRQLDDERKPASGLTAPAQRKVSLGWKSLHFTKATLREDGSLRLDCTQNEPASHPVQPVDTAGAKDGSEEP